MALMHNVTGRQTLFQSTWSLLLDFSVTSCHDFKLILGMSDFKDFVDPRFSLKVSVHHLAEHACSQSGINGSPEQDRCV